jgi:hypothetical protein
MYTATTDDIGCTMGGVSVLLAVLVLLPVDVVVIYHLTRLISISII